MTGGSTPLNQNIDFLGAFTRIAQSIGDNSQNMGVIALHLDWVWTAWEPWVFEVVFGFLVTGVLHRIPKLC